MDIKKYNNTTLLTNTWRSGELILMEGLFFWLPKCFQVNAKTSSFLRGLEMTVWITHGLCCLSKPVHRMKYPESQAKQVNIYSNVHHHSYTMFTPDTSSTTNVDDFQPPTLSSDFNLKSFYLQINCYEFNLNNLIITSKSDYEI